eukprot:jgi/Psemu1/59533/gm1.59533_g
MDSSSSSSNTRSCRPNNNRSLGIFSGNDVKVADLTFILPNTDFSSDDDDGDDDGDDDDDLQHNN